MVGCNVMMMIMSEMIEMCHTRDNTWRNRMRVRISMDMIMVVNHMMSGMITNPVHDRNMLMVHIST